MHPNLTREREATRGSLASEAARLLDEVAILAGHLPCEDREGKCVFAIVVRGLDNRL